MLKFIFSLLLSFSILINFSYAEEVKEIKISGNSRISDETIKVLMEAGGKSEEPLLTLAKKRGAPIEIINYLQEQ